MRKLDRAQHEVETFATWLQRNAGIANLAARFRSGLAFKTPWRIADDEIELLQARRRAQYRSTTFALFNASGVPD